MVALTGGIGAGKSTVAERFRARGALVIDADRIAREVVEPGTPALDAIVDRFGPGVLNAEGRLDRAALAGIVFGDEVARRDLEAITHPAINAEIRRRASAAPLDAVVICDVPLMGEARARGSERTYDEVIVVEAPREARLARLEARGMERVDALARMDAQVSDEERRTRATWVISNDGDLDAVDAQVEEIWTELQARRD